MRCDTSRQSEEEANQCFNPHTYMRCDVPQFWNEPMFYCFNPHTYMRCDYFFIRMAIIPYVSIHTPTWGVTFKFYCYGKTSIVSIHTPTWGVTYSLRLKFLLGLFQSTHLHEVWLIGGMTQYIEFDVSIHTPTWGVTSSLDCKKQLNMFQSTHLHEVWPLFTFSSIVSPSFQSTHLHEVWLISPLMQHSILCFNPHTYMRCDFAPCGHCKSCIMFQSTHLHEVWHIVSWLLILNILFQSTHLHEVWRYCETITNFCWRFNPHTYMRCDSSYSRIW